MIQAIRNSSKLIVLAFVIMGAFGCKSKKKAMEAAEAERKAKMEQEAADRRRAEEIARQEAEDKARQEAEAKRRAAETPAPETKLDQYFNAIATSGNIASANASINEALTMFASPDTPVLIVISEENGMKDYDKPTTIQKYLNYLKDQKKNMNAISDIKSNSQGKITELELRKN